MSEVKLYTGGIRTVYDTIFERDMEVPYTRPATTLEFMEAHPKCKEYRHYGWITEGNDSTPIRLMIWKQKYESWSLK